MLWAKWSHRPEVCQSGSCRLINAPFQAVKWYGQSFATEGYVTLWILCPSRASNAMKNLVKVNNVRKANIGICPKPSLSSFTSVQIGVAIALIPSAHCQLHLNQIHSQSRTQSTIGSPDVQRLTQSGGVMLMRYVFAKGSPTSYSYVIPTKSRTACS